MTEQEAAVERAAEAYHKEHSRENMSALIEVMEPLIETWLKCEGMNSPMWADAECLQAGRLKLLDIAPDWSSDGAARFVAYAKPNIVGAMRHAARAARRGHGREQRIDCSLDDLPDELPGLNATGDTEHTLRLTAQQMLSELPDTLRIIARMYYIEGYTTKEIASVGGFTEDAVAQLLQQVIVRLQAQGAAQ